LEKIKIAIINGEVFINKRFRKVQILIEDKKIKRVIYRKLNEDDLKGYFLIDAQDSYVSAGFIDPHVHFRCPGQEHKEDWNTGTRAAIKGGFTFVMDMPNNIPSATNYNILYQKNNLAKLTNINYGFYLGLSDTNSGNIKKIFNFCKKKVPLYGIKVFLGSSTGDLLVKNEQSIKYSLNTGEINLFHCEDENTLARYKHIQYNSVSDHNAIRPPESEIEGIKRIIRQAKAIKSKAKIYICHISSAKQLKYLKKLRKLGYNIINEVTPHHLFFSLSNIEQSNIFKVNPPIREESDVKYLRRNFNKGFFDVIGTDHAPHKFEEKNSPTPPSGFPGLETAFYALYNLYEQKILSLNKIFELFTSGYKIFGIKKRGEIKKGNFADITIIKKIPNTFKAEKSETKADFSCYDNLKTNCKIDTVIINGKIVLKDSEFLPN